MSDKESRNIQALKRQYADGKLNRREFIRFATLLGVAAPAAYAMVGEAAPARAQAQTMPSGGTLRVGTRIKDLKNPHTYSWGGYDSNVSRQVIEYLSFTDEQNVTKPYMLESWNVTEDLKTWTLKVRNGVKWHNGQDFTADDVIWNLKQLTDPAVGSSFIGLVKGYLMKDATGADGKPTSVLWDASAIEKVDGLTVRLNCKEPQVPVPEHLFHYPAAMMFPGENGVFQPGSQGTGPFELVSVDTGKQATLRRAKSYWGQAAHLDEIQQLDMGDDPAAAIAALASKQIHGLLFADPAQYDALKAMPHLALYQAQTAETAVFRMHPDKPFDDPRVRRAMKMGLDKQAIVQVALRGIGIEGDHTHVSPAQPDYEKIPTLDRDVAGAKKLLADAGYPNGIETTLMVPNDIPWIVAMSQAAAEQWKEIGAKINLNVVPGAQYWDVWTKVPFGVTIWYHRPLAMMVLGLGYRTGVPWNESAWSNKQFDEILTKSEGTLDMGKRRAMIGDLEKIMHEEGPIAQPIFRNVFTFYDKAVQGVKMHPSNYFFGDQFALVKT